MKKQSIFRHSAIQFSFDWCYIHQKTNFKILLNDSDHTVDITLIFGLNELIKHRFQKDEREVLLL